MALGIGTTLFTSADASLTLQFADGSRLLLHGGSELKLDKLSAYGATGMTDTRMRLPKGRTSSEVKPLRGSGSVSYTHLDVYKRQGTSAHGG